MIKAKYSDKARAVDILTHSFQDNKSVNYIIKQDSQRIDRIKKLMEYSFDMCFYFGDIFFTEDKNGCALLLLSDKKKTNLKSISLDIKLIVSCIGISNLKKAMDRESKIKKLQPEGLKYYLWFIGVDPIQQNKGIGSMLLRDVIKEGVSINRPVYLETSTLKNIPWYEKFGFSVYNKLDLGYELFFLRRVTG